jgi:hypothetical protein
VATTRAGAPFDTVNRSACRPPPTGTYNDTYSQPPREAATTKARMIGRLTCIIHTAKRVGGMAAASTTLMRLRRIPGRVPRRIGAPETRRSRVPSRRHSARGLSWAGLCPAPECACGAQRSRLHSVQGLSSAWIIRASAQLTYSCNKIRCGHLRPGGTPGLPVLRLCR